MTTGICVSLMYYTVLDSPANLVSLVVLLKKGSSVSECNVNKIILVKDQFQMIAQRDKNDLWILPTEIVNEKTESNAVACLSISNWHRCFAHQNVQYTREILNRLGIKCEKTEFDDDKCVSCLKGKICRITYQPNLHLAKEVGELTHIDMLLSPSNSIGGSKYALVFKDDLSKFRTVYFLKTKENTVNLFEDYPNRLETQTGNEPKRIRSDNGTEEVNMKIDKLCS